MSNIKIGSTVMTPITDAEGEATYIFGKLVDINSRWAKIETAEGEIVRVGKNKIEEVQKPARKATKKVMKEESESPQICTACGVNMDDNGIGIHEMGCGDKSVKHDERLYICLGCGNEFGPLIRTVGRIAENYEYEKCIAASGRISCDNNDDVATTLRGKTLDEVYNIAANTLNDSDEENVEETKKTLMMRYGHLNPGQQRMCLGNRVRGFLSK